MKKRLVSLVLIVVLFASIGVTAFAHFESEDTICYEAMALDNLNLRDEEGKIITVIPVWSIVTVTGKEEDSRILVEWEGQKGTVLNVLRRMDRKALTNCSLNQRRQDGELIQCIPANETVTLEEDVCLKNERTLVSYKGETGTVLTSELIKDFIIIALDGQMVYKYKDYKIYCAGPTVTGEEGTEYETPKGVFSVQGKIPNKTLTGPDYSVFVNYWMPIYRGIGIHDADRWRSAYGSNIYTYYGSHGCINVSLRLAKLLFESVEEGEIVVVR